jgi:membrane-associated protease RseP (regulator of RpoE activity)
LIINTNLPHHSSHSSSSTHTHTHILYIGGVIANFLLTFLLASGTAVTSGIGHPSFYPGLSVTTTSTSSSPAEKAGIKINDVILKINGRDIVGSETAISEFIGTIRTNANKEIILEVLRNPDSRTTKDLEGSKLDGAYSAKIDRIALVPVEGKCTHHPCFCC